MPRKSSRTRVLTTVPEGLEARGLMTVGIGGGLNVVVDLGEVSPARAARGVEVSATIAAHESITFRFGAETSGNYLLEIHHIGDGLTLEAMGPSGSASVPPGPAGPSKTIALPLKAATYEITASATKDQPVFVDWELLLASAVGQSSGTGTALVAASGALPPPSISGPVAPSASPSVGLPSSTPSGSWGMAVAPSMVADARPMGRSEPTEAITPVGPTTPDGALALADSSAGLTVGALMALGTDSPKADGSDEVTPSPTLLTLEVLGDGRQDIEALGLRSWLERLGELPFAQQSRWITPSAQTGTAESTEGALSLVAAEPVEQDADGGKTFAASSGWIAAGAIIATAFRRRGRLGFARGDRRWPVAIETATFPLSMIRGQ